MDLLKSIVEVIIQNAPENFFLQIIYYSLAGILVVFIFRLALHLLIRLISGGKLSSRPFKLRVDRNYDFVEGWRDKGSDDNGKEE